MRWLQHELLEEYIRTGDFSPIHEYLAPPLEEFERHVLLQSFFMGALETSDWKLARHCCREGISMNPSEVFESGPLHSTISVLGGRPEAIEWLISNGADVERRSGNYTTPLFSAVCLGYDDTVRALLHAGADVNSSTMIDDNSTPLMAAAIRGHGKIAKLLMKAMVNILVEIIASLI